MSFNFQASWLVTVILILIFSVLVFLLYRATSPPLTLKKRWLLAFLRILALVCIFLIVASTIFSFTFKKNLRPTLAILIDNSSSMNFKDQKGSRKQALESILKSEFMKKFPAPVDLSYYLFSDTLIKTTSPDKFDLRGNATSLGTALAELKSDLKEKNVAGALILSDGGDNFGPDPVKISSELEFPVYACGIGSEIYPKDIALEDVSYNEIVYKDNQVPLGVSLTSSGFENQKIPIELKSGKNLLEHREFQLSGSGQKQKAVFYLTPQEEGIHRYTLSIPHLPGEFNYQNNQRSFTLKVLKSKIKVLAFTNNLSWEFTFLKRFLESQKNLECRFVLYGSNQKALTKEFPRDEKELEQFDLLISVNSTLDFFRGKEEKFNDWVLKKGKSILLLLGPEAISLSRIKGKLESLPFKIESSNPRITNFQLQLSAEGKLHPITNLSTSETDNQKTWSSLPPFLGIVPVDSVATDAKVLAFYSVLEGEDELPGILLKSFPSSGKVMVTLAYPFWRWDFLQWGVGQNNQSYQTFWANSILWLIAPEEKEKFFVKTDRLIYKSGEKVNFQAQVYNEFFQKIQGAEIQLKAGLKLENKNQTLADLILTEDELGNYGGEFKASQPGRYFYEAAIRKEGKLLGASKGEFMVEEFSLEDQSLTLNRKLLTQIAEAGGGKYYDPEELGNFSQDLKTERKSLEKKKTIQLWNHPLLLIFFILFISWEWFLRKKNQLP